jgi:hypothetical protein
MDETYGTTVPGEELGGHADGTYQDTPNTDRDTPANTYPGTPAEADRPHLSRGGWESCQRVGRALRERPFAVALGAAALGMVAGRYLRGR